MKPVTMFEIGKRRSTPYSQIRMRRQRTSGRGGWMLPAPSLMLEWAALTPRTVNADMEVSSPAFTAAYVDWFLTHNGPYKK